jgi:hypothetical protein
VPLKKAVCNFAVADNESPASALQVAKKTPLETFPIKAKCAVAK